MSMGCLYQYTESNRRLLERATEHRRHRCQVGKHNGLRVRGVGGVASGVIGVTGGVGAAGKTGGGTGGTSGTTGTAKRGQQTRTVMSSTEAVWHVAWRLRHQPTVLAGDIHSMHGPTRLLHTATADRRSLPLPVFSTADEMGTRQQLPACSRR